MALVLNGAFFANGAVSVGAVGFAAFSEHRRQATMCAALLTASWMVSCASYTSYSIDSMLSRLGVSIGYIDIWSIMNAIVGIFAVLLANRVWWGWALFGLLLAACINDVTFGMGFKQWDAFSVMADWLFWGEAAIFYGIGIGGAVTAIGSYAARWRIRPVRDTVRLRSSVKRGS